MQQRPHTPAVSSDDPLDVGQADARTFELLSPMQPLKDAEQPVRVRHIEADAVVLDENHCFAGRSIDGADFDSRVFPLTGILCGVRQKVREDQLQHVLIAGNVRKRLKMII